MHKKPPYPAKGKPRSHEAFRAPARPGNAQPHRVVEDRPAPSPFRHVSGRLNVLFGFHPVREALRAGRRRALTLYATAAAAERLAADCTGAGIEPRIVTADDLNRRLGPEAVHQGVMLEAEPPPALALEDIQPKSGVVLVLDQITDPHNVGAIIRTAAAFGVDALVMTERHAPDLSGTLAKAASGGLEHVPVVHVVNMARALEELKDLGYLRVGLDSEGPMSLDAAPLSRPMALVLGAEDKGLRRLTRENCDALARLAMPGAIKSLNVSNACAVALSVVSARLAPLHPPQEG